MKEKIRLLKQDIEKQLIFLKIESNSDFIISMAKKIKLLKRALKKLKATNKYYCEGYKLRGQGRRCLKQCPRCEYLIKN
jgi:hypothetical protein